MLDESTSAYGMALLWQVRPTAQGKQRFISQHRNPLAMYLLTKELYMEIEAVFLLPLKPSWLQRHFPTGYPGYYLRKQASFGA